ncbi:MAG: purine-nucleoside phosphorylase [Christensenella sp.]|nr:purine-nucleoside phosphorylase [Christensenella sp.]
MNTIMKRIDSAEGYIRSKVDIKPVLGMILGSGLGGFADLLEDAIRIPFRDIPGFPVPSVEGHAGELVIGKYGKTPVAILSGRVHFYEGQPQSEITIPVRVLRRLGADTLILTNAAGGINLDFSAGALMLIRDHINYSGQNPLIGENLGEFGPRFPDMTDIYTKELREELKQRAQLAGILLSEGVYAMYSGPSYETPAEIRMFRTLGADAVGMSTVPEAIVARHCGMRVIGISCITNMAAGVTGGIIYHAEVVETANRVKREFKELLQIAIDLCADQTWQA